MIRYSFIIPHYNTPQLLARCLQSIPQRPDVQIVVVDDCSPCGLDSVRAVIAAAQRHDVELYSTPQGGSAGRARNLGLKHAVGQWLFFADADDYYTDGFLEIIDQEINRCASSSESVLPDVLYFDVMGDGQRADWHQRVFACSKEWTDDTLIRYQIWAPWNKVFSRRLIIENGLQFEEIPVGNDAMFCLRFSQLVRNYRIIDRRLYCLTDNAGSITFRGITFSRELDYLKVRIRITRFLERLNLHLRYGYTLWSVARMRRLAREYGWGRSLQYTAYVSLHYGLFRALCYNRARRAYDSAHADRLIPN